MKKTFLLAAWAGLLGAGLAAAQQSSLKEAFKDRFLLGAALNTAQFTGQDARDAELVKTQFNSITPENVLKWQFVHPAQDRYEFALPDRFVAFGEQNHMFIVGHALVWHHQTPAWVFENGKGGPADRETLLKRMHEHIRTVVGRYKGRIGGWDVVNEALNDDGTLRQTPWLKIIGEDYIAKAFEFAHEADPQVELYYNDYSMFMPAKRDAAVRLIGKLKAAGVPVTGIGMQGHYQLRGPSLDQVDAAIAAFGKLGVKVMITELDLDVLPPALDSQGADLAKRAELAPKLNPYPDGLPDRLQLAKAARYAGLFSVFLKHRDVVSRVTFWGVTDANSWLNNWPVRGRTNYPLLFGRDGQITPAFAAVLRVARHGVE